VNIITFCPEPILEQCRDLLRFLDSSFPELPREHFNSLPELVLRLQRPRGQHQILVFLAPDHLCLELLVGLRREVQGNDLLLILPDSQDATQTLGHLLRPRLLTSLNEDVRVVEEVLAQVIHRAQARDMDKGALKSQRQVS
jgi:hypothetical protein